MKADNPALKFDLAKLKAMSDEEVVARALTDPDNLPLTDDQLQRMKRVTRVRFMRRRLGISQEAFAERFRIPLGTLRDWEQGRKEPDSAAKAYLEVIAKMPNEVMKLLQK
jgi:putative transcriptional regulator